MKQKIEVGGDRLQILLNQQNRPKSLIEKVGGERGIRSLGSPLDSERYRDSIATGAIFAMVAAPHCTGCTGDLQAARRRVSMGFPSSRGRGSDTTAARGQSRTAKDGEMSESEWLKEHAWKLTPAARADAHQDPPTHFRSST